MNRSVLDKLVSTTGLVISVVLFAASAGLLYAHNFIHNQVHDQLAAEQIFFPGKGSASLAALPQADQDKVAKYAGQQLVTGAQAEVFADHYIAVHLKKIGGGKTYSQVSAASIADPTNAMLAKQASTLFQGESLRGMLLNAYAFDTMAVVAGYAAAGALTGAAVLLVLAALGFMHAARVAQTSSKAAKKRR